MSAHPVTVTLPDGKTRSFDGPVTGTELAASIGPGLAKAALAWKVDGELWDLFRPLERDAKVSVVTAKDPEAVGLVRHDAAHVLAMAVQELYPGTQVTIGPVIEDGFYYDFARDEPFHPDDLARIEARMKEIVDEDRPTSREVMPRDEAIDHFEKLGEKYKAELIRDLPETEEIKIYHHGPWHDLCRGPHLVSTAKVGKAFKLMKIAGAYWRGDHRNPMLQRIYGTAWMSEKELEAYLHRLEEAEKRDHRKLGRELGLFHIQEEAQGMIFWHPKGWTVYRELESYIRRKTSKAGYVEVKTPQLVDRKLWEMSGHWEKFRENMFTTETEDEKVLALKPMNCPCHVQIFNQGLKSYRDLPILMAEFGSCHRYEPSGSLHGLMRVRNFVQDDAHIFCTEGQTTSESEKFCQLILECYRELGFADVSVKFSDRPPVRAGSDEVWDRAEAALKAAVEHVGLEYTLNPGEGAFYGPKLEFVLRDAIGRDWQCGTLQMDFVLPERLGASYIGEDGEKHRPVMLHRAILGSLERFIGILIEEHAGKFPPWLAPVQAMVTTITSEADDYAQSVFDRLKAAGIRAAIDLRNEKINFKVREHSMQKIPVIAVAGRREAEEGTVSLRRLGSQDQSTVSVDAFIAQLLVETRPPDLAQ